MFKSLGNNNSIPNNYVYQSHRGTDYMYLDGSWMNCETMKVVESTHNFKMNQAAKIQIAEHNEKNSLQIGKKYVINESSYTYVGRNNFTINGNLLTESMNTKVQRLVEADEAEHKPGQKNDQIPNYYETSYGRNNTRYTYKDGWWIEKDSEHKKAVHNPQLNSEITNDAIEQIQHHDSDPKAAMPIGTEIDHKGTKLTYIGDAFVTADGKRTSSEFTDQMEKKAKAEKAGQSAEQGTEEPGSSDEANSESPAQGSQSSTEVPNGYVYKSGKGKSYFKKNGQWFSVETKKPMNSSAVQPLERAAKAQIDKFNSTSPVKIGQEWKSKKGVSYKYAGDNRWIADNGKMLPQSTAQALMQQLSAQGNQDQSAQDEPEQAQGEQGQPTPNEQGQSQDDQAPQPSPSQGAPSGSSSNEGGDSSLQGLANEIKSNPYAGKIVVLLSRGDEVSLLAADILLSGSQKEAVQILNSLNNKD